MRNPSLILVGWMVASMIGVGVSVAWAWPFWVVVSLGVGLVGVAVLLTRNIWDQTRENHEDVMTGVRQLEQLSGIDEARTSRVLEPEAFGGHIQRLVENVKKRMTGLEEERTKIIAIMENLVEGVVAFDPKGKVLFTNSSAHRILGLDAQAIQGRSLWEIIRNQELAGLVEGCQELAWHERRQAEVELHPPVSMVLEVYALPFPFSNQKKGSVLVLHDVTQLRRLEQVRTEFVENVSHELRTPLTAIVGYLETLVDEPSLETPNNRKFVQVAHQHAVRLSRLVEDLRSLSEIESGKVVLRCESVPLCEVAQDVSEMFQHQLSKKNLQISNKIGVALSAWVDRDRLIQILVNLVDNAIKYTSDGGTITFQSIPLGDERISLQIKDTGQGIPSTDLPRITERFYRVDRARSREEGGTGLGLSIVKHLLQLLDGKLRIQSELGKGTTVEVILPIASPTSSSRSL
ncbi:ATP-binding protein [Candidatus Nitrospira allomarina]|uniref:histidine kinase n=1 Tax=Candidatus Nitrospira allomarina TaxID=3020900 RepID=A0AA96GF10_9BACT|nr:ATP-binding protein [Candidatus Nitrospira allomarina]WNM56546.1 ATP-binding protein [Candidatus Nitrospira allomarina]